MLIIIVLIIGLRYTIPDTRIAIEDISGTIPSEENNPDVFVKKSAYSVKQGSADLSPGGSFRKQSYIKKPIPKKTKVDINKGDSATLERLPGIGPVLSVRIIKYRHLLGGFVRIEQLKEVYGLTEETYEKIKGRVFADSSQITRININSATYKEILHFPYFEKYEVTAIMKYRELKGRITGIEDLTENKLISTEKAYKVRPYIKYDE